MTALLDYFYLRKQLAP